MLLPHPDNPTWFCDASVQSGYGLLTERRPADGRQIVINDTDLSFYYRALQEVGPDRVRAWVWKPHGAVEGGGERSPNPPLEADAVPHLYRR